MKENISKLYKILMNYIQVANVKMKVFEVNAMYYQWLRISRTDTFVTNTLFLFETFFPTDYIFAKLGTMKPVYNDHLMGYFSAFWSSSRWPRAT